MLGSCLATTPALATENGNQEYPIGVNTVLPGVEPPPGATEYYDYVNFYDAGSSVDGNGNKAAPGFHVNVFANAFRVLHSWDLRLGQFWFTSGAVAPLVNLNIRVAGMAQSDGTFGDIDLQVLYLNWKNKTETVFTFGGLDIYVPTGHYRPTDLANVGLNYTTYMPNGAVTWFASKRLQISLDVSYMIPSQNLATHYKSGQAVDFDWAADYSPIRRLPKLFFGLQGYAYQQVTGDYVDDQLFQGGNEGRTIAIGPQIRYDLFHGGVALKYQHEFAVENRPKADKVWFQFALPVEFL